MKKGERGIWICCPCGCGQKTWSKQLSRDTFQFAATYEEVDASCDELREQYEQEVNEI